MSAIEQMDVKARRALGCVRNRAATCAFFGNVACMENTSLLLDLGNAFVNTLIDDRTARLLEVSTRLITCSREMIERIELADEKLKTLVSMSEQAISRMSDKARQEVSQDIRGLWH
jgi:hypothetical protein